MKTKMNKTIFITALIISILLLLTSCVASNEVDALVNGLNVPKVTTPQTIVSTQTTVPVQTTASTEKELAKTYIDIYQLTVSTYDEYLSFISSTKLPSEFVYFDFINQFGKFAGLVILSPSERGDYSSYLYSFEGGLGLYVYHDRTIDDEVAQSTGFGLTLTSDVNRKDMRTIKTEEKKMFLESSFLYSYIQGELISVKWQSDGILFVLSGSGNAFDKIPIDSENEASKLFKTETASEVVEKLSEKIKAAKK